MTTEQPQNLAESSAPRRGGELAPRAPEPLANEGPTLTLHEPERMNLLGLLMRGLLASNLGHPELRRRAARLRGEVAVRAGDMDVTLSFAEDGVHIRAAKDGSLAAAGAGPRARVSGDMKALLDVVTGGGLVGPVLRGRVRIGGNPFLLLRILPLIRVRATEPEASP